MKLLTIYDQTGQLVKIPENPQRIVSLVPSQTELLFDLGLDNQIVGVTKFCIRPYPRCKAKEQLGGTKKLHLDKIFKLNPDIIIANKEENTKTEIESLAEIFPVWISDIKDMEDAFSMIRSVGKITNTYKKADVLVNNIKLEFNNIVKLPRHKVLYLIWNNPFMVAGQATFINTLIEQTGMENIIQESRYPTIDDIATLDPDVVLLSSEPYPFNEEHQSQIQKLLPNAQVLLVEGDMFSWYGSRLRYFPDYVNSNFIRLRSSQK